MYQEPEFLFIPPGFAPASHERKEPTHDLIFSGGSPIVPLQLSQRQQRCLRLTVNTRLFESPGPNTHYWYSRDMDWWFSAAKQVLDDLHRLLTSQNHADRSLLLRVSLCGPWRCGPWKSQVTWLSRFIHRYYETNGTFLHPFRSRVDKHLKDHPDPLHFDAFLLQCWSEMTLSVDQRRTFLTIEYLNDKAPEICADAIRAYINRMALFSVHGEQHLGLCDHEPWISRPAANLETWARFQPELNREHRAMFMEYARHLIAEFNLDREAAPLGSREWSPRHDEMLARLRGIERRINSYINCVVVLAQREVGMVRCPCRESGSSSRGWSSTTSRHRPATSTVWGWSSQGPATSTVVVRSTQPVRIPGRRSSGCQTLGR